MPQRALSDIYGPAPQAPAEKPPQGWLGRTWNNLWYGDQAEAPAPPPPKSLDEIYGPTTTESGAFDLAHLAQLEKEFGLKAPAPVAAPEPLPTPWSLIARAPKFITEPARKAADWMTDPNNAVRGESIADAILAPVLGPMLPVPAGQRRGFVGGALQGAAELASPLNVATTLAGVGAEGAAARGLGGLAGLLRGVNTAATVPMVAHGAYSVANNPEDWQAYAELAGGLTGAVAGFRSGPIEPGGTTSFRDWARGGGGGGLDTLQPPTKPPTRFSPAAPAEPIPSTDYSTYTGAARRPPAPPAPNSFGGRVVGEPQQMPPYRPAPGASIDEVIGRRAPTFDRGINQTPFQPEPGPSIADVVGRPAPGFDRGINQPLRGEQPLGGADTLTPGSPNQPYGPEPIGRPMAGRNINQPLRPAMSLDDIYGPIKPTPMEGAGTLPVAPDLPVEPGSITPTAIREAQGALERGEPIAPELARFFGLTPERPIGTGLSDVGQMDLARNPQRGSALPPGPPDAAAPTAPRSSVPNPRGSAPAAADAGWPSNVPAGQMGLDSGQPLAPELSRFFGMEAPPLPPAGRAPVAPPVREPLPSVGEMTVERLREGLRTGDPTVVNALKGVSGDRLPPDVRNELGMMLDDMQSRPFMAGETIDTMHSTDGMANAGPGWRDSGVGGVMFENNPEFPNLIRHTAGAPVFHDIMDGRSGTRASVETALERILNGGRPTTITDRAGVLAQQRLAGRRAPMGDILDPARMGKIELPGTPEGLRPADLPEMGGVGRIDFLPNGEQQPRLPGGVGDVRDLEVTQPPVAPVPKPGFDLTAPPETQAGQTGLFGPSAAVNEPPPGVHPKLKELWEFLSGERAKKVAHEEALVAEGNPLADPNAIPPLETVAELEARIRNEPNPRNLWAKERKVRAIFDQGGFAAPNMLGTLAGGGTGALAGAAADREHPWRGAALGALAGVGAVHGGQRLARSGIGQTLRSGPAFGPEPPPGRILQSIMDADALAPPDLRPKAYRPEGGTYTGPDIPRGGKFNRADYPNLPSEAEVSADVNRLIAGRGSVRPTDLAITGGPSAFGSDTGAVDVGALRTGLPTVMKQLEKFGMASMLSGPSTLVKGHLGPLGAGLSRAAEEVVAGRPRVGFDIVKNMATSKNSRQAYVRALREGSADPNATRWGETQGITGVPGRAMAAPDAWVTQSMTDAGIDLASAKRSAFTADPRTTTANALVELRQHLGPIGRVVAAPFFKTAANLTERGIERTPGLGLLMELLTKAEPSAARDIIARQLLGAVAVGGGYMAQGDSTDLRPNPYALAALGPYAVPAAVGGAFRSYMNRGPAKPNAATSSGSRAMRDMVQAVLNQSPLPTEGYELDRLMDPRQWPTRFVPRMISSFTNPGQYNQPGPLDPLIARIPFLNEAMLTKRRPARPVRPSR